MHSTLGHPVRAEVCARDDPHFYKDLTREEAKGP
jgi:hypothetical protein